MNIDTDMQWAYWEGVKSYYNEFKNFLQRQIGNSKSADEPNKKYYDPRKWLREGEKRFVKRLSEAFEDLNCVKKMFKQHRLYFLVIQSPEIHKQKKILNLKIRAFYCSNNFYLSEHFLVY